MQHHRGESDSLNDDFFAFTAAASSKPDEGDSAGTSGEADAASRGFSENDKATPAPPVAAEESDPYDIFGILPSGKDTSASKPNSAPSLDTTDGRTTQATPEDVQKQIFASLGIT